jgi:hypothetical protein
VVIVQLGRAHDFASQPKLDGCAAQGIWHMPRPSEAVRPTRASSDAVMPPKTTTSPSASRRARFVARMLTVAQTLRSQGRRVYEFLTDPVDAHRWGGEPPPRGYARVSARST